MKDARTTIFGATAGVCGLLDFFFPGLSAVCEPLGNAALILFAWFAADGR